MPAPNAPGKSVWISPLLAAVLLLSACGGGSDNGAQAQQPSPDSAVTFDDLYKPLDVPLPATSGLRGVIEPLGLRGDPAIGRDLPSIDEPLAQLGMKLFFTKALGGDQDSACASCHHPMLGGGDDLSLSIGVGAVDPDLLGPGRQHSPQAPFYDGGPPVPRNAPSTFNAGMWDHVMFMDGRVESLGATPLMNGADGKGITTPDMPYPQADPNAWSDLVAAQSLFPITSAEEMRGFSLEAGMDTHALRRHLQARLGNYGIGAGELSGSQWEQEFRTTFNRPWEPVETLVTSERIALAMAAYQRSQVFTNTPWKAWIEGDDSAISEAAKRGALLFFLPPEKGGVNCVACHRGDNFSDEQFHVLATPQIGRGKGNGSDGTNDYGRFNVTGNPDDRFAFRTPSLLNVTVTGPWSHAGAYTSLEAVVRHHLNPELAIEHYDYAQIDPAIDASHMRINTAEALQQLDQLYRSGHSKLTIKALSDDQVADLIAFLKTLTDPCVESRECLSPWIPDSNTFDPDGERLKSHDALGKSL